MKRWVYIGVCGAVVSCSDSPARPDAATDVGTPDLLVADAADLPRNDVSSAALNVVFEPPLLEIDTEGEFAVSIVSAPAAEVTVELGSDADWLILEPQSVVFGPDDWDRPQLVNARLDLGMCFQASPQETVVTATGVGLESAEASVLSHYHHDPSISVSPTAVTVVEDGSNAAPFDVVLGGCVPEGQVVTIPVSASHPMEFSVSTDQLMFESSNYDTPQTVTVTGVDDSCVEPLRMHSVVLGAASGGGYDGVDADDVAVTVVDNDSAAVTVTPSILSTSETGTIGTFDVVPVSGRCDDQTFTGELVATVLDPSEGLVSPERIAFDEGDVGRAFTFTVTGRDDALCDGAQTYQIALSITSDNPAIDGIAVSPVAVTNSDDDGPGVIVTPSVVTVAEPSGSATVSVVPSGCVPGETITVSLSSTDPTEATVSPTSLDFDDTNFGVGQDVTITAVDDAVQDGDRTVVIVTTMSATLVYAGVDPPDISVLVVDDD